MRTPWIVIAALSLSAPAFAQEAVPVAPAPPTAGQEEDGQLVVDVTGGQRAALPIAVPFMPTPQSADTPAGNTAALGRQVAEIVAADLRNSELFTPIGPSGLNPVSYPQVTAPDFGYFGRRP